MSILRGKVFLFVAAVLTFFAFSADVLDDVADRVQLAAQTSSSSHQHKGTTANNGGHGHDEHAIAAAVIISVPAELPEIFVFPPADEVDPTGLPASIDHPPQLA